MPIYSIQAPDGHIYDVEAPEGASERDLYSFVNNEYLKNKKPVVQAAAPEAGFSTKDVGVALGQGIVGAGKSIADVFGADNAVSNYLAGISGELGQAYTPGRQAEMQRREQLQKEASASGSIVKEIQTFLGGVAEAPVQALAQGLGSIVPYVGTGIIGRVSKLGGPTVRAINTVVGAAQGAGTVKGSIYDNVKDELLRENPRMTEKEAKEKASKAQEYLGSNFLDIAAGAALGGVAARYGVENLLTPGIAAKLDASLLPRVGKAIMAEAPLEGLQGGQEQLAVNRALTDVGFRRDAMQGVYGSAIRDAVIGGMTAGLVGVRGPGKAPTAAPPIEPPAEPKKPEAAAPTPGAPAPTTPMLDEQGNLISSKQATPEELATLKVEAQKEKVAELQKDVADMMGTVEFKTPTKTKETKATEPKFEGLTAEAQKLVDLAAHGAKPPVELTSKEIERIAETNAIPYIKDGLPLLYDDLIKELNAKAGVSNGPINAEASGTSAEVSGERRGVPAEGTGESDGLGVVDTRSNAEPTEFGEGIEQSTLIIPPAKQAQEVTEEITKKEPFLGIEPSAGEVQTEEELKAKAEIARKENEAKAVAEKAAEPTLEEKIKLKEELENVKKTATSLLAGTEDAKKLYDSLPKNTQAKVDELLDKVKKLKKPEVAKTRKRAEKPVGISYTPAQYKKQVAKEKKEAKAAKEEPAPKKLSLLEERLQQFRETKSFGSANLEALEALRGGTTVGMVADLMNGDLRGALQEIANDTTGEFTALDKLVAKRLLNAKTLPKVEVVPESQLGGSNGRYDAATDTAYIGENSMTSHTVLHEALHGFTLAIIKAHKDGIINNPGVRNLDELYEHLKANYPELQGKYGMESLVEFVSEVMSNSDFQEQLNAIPYKRTNVFTEFARAILRMLGISPTDNFTALAYAMVSTESILSEGRKLEETNPPPATAALANKPDVTGLKQTEKEKKHSKVTFDEYLNNIKTHTEDKLPTPSREKVRKALTTTEGGLDIIKKFQNRRHPLRRIYIALERAGLLKTTGEDINNVAAQFDTAAAIADNRDRSTNRKVRDETVELIGTYAKAAGISEQDALANLQMYFETMHEPERRAVKYMLTVPLSNDPTLMYLGKPTSPADRRAQILNFLNNYKETDQAKRHSVVKGLRKELDNIIANKANLDANKGILLNINDPKYNVVAGLDPDKIASFKQQLLAKPDVKNHLATFEAISKNLKIMNDNNKVLNAEGNFWTVPVDNWAEFYGFQNYVPFKGKPDTAEEDDNYDPSRKMLVGLQEGVNPMEGRESQADNPVIQVMIDTVNAARRAGYKDVTLSIKNAVQQGYLSGNIKEVIKFDSNRTENIKKQRGQNNVFHYEPNGDISVIELTNKEQREAIRNTYKEDHPFVAMLDSVTGTIAHFHTRYNPSFAPVNFVGDLMTNIFNMGAEFGPTTSGQLLKNIAAVVGSGGLHKAARAAVEYNKNGTKNLRKYIDKNSKDYDPFYADLVEYLERGGKVSYMQAFDTESNTSKTIKTIKRGGKETTKAQIDAVIDVWGNAFEFASRTASYRTAKEIYLKQNKERGMADAEAQEDAKQRATYYAKNLANFEQVGEYGKVFGAFYMFARPAATGAVRAIEALTPALRKYIGRENFDTSTAEGAALERQAKSGALMFLALLGLGVAAYTMATMLSDDDEEGRNRTATDDMDRWQKYMRFHIPKDLVGGRDDVILQMRWGYGLGSFASAGAQIAAVAAGNSSFKTAGANILQSGLDSFLPLPISRINPFDHTAAWFLDTATPSAFRPFLEYTMNLDGLGREIYNNRQSLIGDAYTGGDNIPEIYKDVARTLHSISDGALDWSPNTMYFFANNGADGLARMVSGTYNLGLVAAGEKAFNPKTDTIPFDGFFGSKSNFDSRQFSIVEKEIQELNKRVKTLEADPAKLFKFSQDNPNAVAAIEFYNKSVNGDLRNIRAEANRIRADRTLSAKERKEMLDNITQMSNLIKRNMLMNLETLGYTP